jgi:hypothetical protein
MRSAFLWADIRKETGRGNDLFKIRDLFADESCSRAIMGFPAATGEEEERRNRWRRRRTPRARYQNGRKGEEENEE